MLSGSASVEVGSTHLRDAMDNLRRTVWFSILECPLQSVWLLERLQPRQMFHTAEAHASADSNHLTDRVASYGMGVPMPSNTSAAGEATSRLSAKEVSMLTEAVALDAELYTFAQTLLNNRLLSHGWTGSLCNVTKNLSSENRSAK